ncbi:MAG: bifunctional hydroxymethylpyrimidine kinase/phosphomethylpyrimidine kinase [Peptostreptococcaceae bacterium]|nr:bifunctional hydroxymethylpyrimidine kinase/phosphomethylpyrimidine kinase [Peptostreptococcaceae bacterium]
MKKINIIGGITADIEGNPYGQLLMGESNPGKISLSYGGVGRNITENLARIGAEVGFVSVAGDDFIGRGVIRELSDLGVNVEHINLLAEENTAIYLSILNIVGEMELALCNMDVLEKVSKSIIDSSIESLRESKIIGIDTNLAEETLVYLIEKLDGIPLFLDPVSAAKAERIKNLIGKFHTVKPNRKEAEIITGLSIMNEDELRQAGKWFEEKGVKRIFITLSGGGVYYKEGYVEGVIKPGQVSIVSATGAGDAFSAAILDGFVKGMNVEETAKYGMAAASIAMESKTPVNPKICFEEVMRRMENE